MQNIHYDAYRIDIGNIAVFQPDSKKYVTLVYLLSGSLYLKSDKETKMLQPGSIVLINKDDVFSLSRKTDNVAIILEISCDYFFRQYTDFYSSKFIFPDDMLTGYARVLIEQVRVKLTRMLIANLQIRQNNYALEMNSCLLELMLILTRYFNYPIENKLLPAARYSKRIEKIIDWINASYQHPISLKEVADRAYVSFSYLSRLFTKEVGVNFSYYLRQLRFQNCLYDVATTVEPIAQIARCHGLVNTRQLTTLCQKRYGKTPLQVRRAYQKGELALSDIPHVHGHIPAQPNKIEPVDVGKTFTLLTTSTDFQYYDPLVPYAHNEERSLALSGNDHREKNSLNYLVTIGKLDEVLKDDVQQQLLRVKEELGEYSLYCYQSIFSQPLPNIYSFPAKTFHTSCYSEMERALKRLERMNISLLIRIDQQVPYEQIENLMRYGMNVFGHGWMRTWRFIFHPSAKGNKEATAECFLRIRTLLNDWLGASQLGVYLQLPDNAREYANLLVDYHDILKAADFLGYRANANNLQNCQLSSHPVFTQSENYIRLVTEDLSKALHSMGLLTPLYLLEWNTLTGNTYRTNGSFFRGALIFNTIMTLPAQVSAVGLWLNLESQHQALQDTHAEITSLALFHVFNIPRPVFHAIKFRERLQGEILSFDNNCLVTKTHNGYQLVLNNTITFDPQLTEKEDLFSCFKKQITLKITAIEPGLYRIKRWLFDQQHGALFWQLEQTSTRYWWDEEVVSMINQRTVPTLTVFDEYIEGEWTTVNKLDINALVFYELCRVY